MSRIPMSFVSATDDALTLLSLWGTAEYAMKLAANGNPESHFARLFVDVEKMTRALCERIKRDESELQGLVPIDLDFVRVNAESKFHDAMQAVFAACIPSAHDDHNGERWSVEDSPSRWAKKLGMSCDSLKRRIDEGRIVVHRPSSKRMQIREDCLPVALRTAK